MCIRDRGYALLGAVSCAPLSNTAATGVGAAASGVGQATGRGSESTGVLAGSVGTGTRATSGELRELREQRERLGNEQVINEGRGFEENSSLVSSGEEVLNAQDLPPLPPLNIEYRYAVPVPGRKGWVYNPYTNRPVDVRGVESGRLIYDERDPENRNEDGTLKSVAEMPNKFRVP